jgi:O-antigen ligase
MRTLTIDGANRPGILPRGQLLYGALCALCTMLLIPVFFAWVGDSYFERVLLISALLLVSIILPIARSGIDQAKARFQIASILWLYLFCSQQFFVREYTPLDQSVNETFASAAYAEALVWIFICAVVLLLYLKEQKLATGLFTGNYKWCVVFAGLATCSALYAPARMLALAWALKLCLAILVLQMLRTTMSTQYGVRDLLATSFLGFAALLMIPIVAIPFTPEAPLFLDGRLALYEHPIYGSEIAGVVLLLMLLKRSLSPSRIDYIWLTIASVLLVLSGGKAAILAAIISGSIYFMLQGKFARAGVLVIAIAVIGYFVVTYSPLAAYLSDYVAAEGANHLTGRTDIWAFAIPMIMEKPLLGHGFMSSKFIGLRTDLSFDPTQWHNSLLEVAYTLGAMGLVIYSALHVVIIKNLLRVYRKSIGERHILCIACIVLYIFVLINAMMDSNFCGGKPSPGFMLFLVLLVASESLASASPEQV